MGVELERNGRRNLALRKKIDSLNYLLLMVLTATLTNSSEFSAQ